MARVAQRLGELLPGVPVAAAADVAGPDAVARAAALRPGQVLVLENLRFDPREQKPDAAFAAALRGLADVYVNDAFGTCHRKDASMHAVPLAFPPGTRAVGLLVEKELHVLDELLGKPKKPMIGIMGGAKVSDKILFIEKVLEKVDALLVGGAMTYTFRAARGESVGKSLVERDKLDLATALLAKAGDRLVLPVDHLVADRLDPAAATRTVTDIPDGWLGVDIGPQTLERYRQRLADAATILWNGPLGKFEDEPFRAGTLGIARAMADRTAAGAVTVVGGGESAEAVEEFGLAERMTHVSTGGGAFLEYVEGKPFAALDAVDEA
jgi:phosphoglycerate kinase